MVLHYHRQAGNACFEALSFGQETRAIDIIVKTKLGFPRDWHKIMTGLWSALTPKLCGQQFHLQKELSH